MLKKWKEEGKLPSSQSVSPNTTNSTPMTVTPNQSDPLDRMMSKMERFATIKMMEKMFAEENKQDPIGIEMFKMFAEEQRKNREEMRREIDEMRLSNVAGADDPTTQIALEAIKVLPETLTKLRGVKNGNDTTRSIGKDKPIPTDIGEKPIDIAREFREDTKRINDNNKKSTSDNEGIKKL